MKNESRLCHLNGFLRAILLCICMLQQKSSVKPHNSSERAFIEIPVEPCLENLSGTAGHPACPMAAARACQPKGQVHARSTCPEVSLPGRAGKLLSRRRWVGRALANGDAEGAVAVQVRRRRPDMFRKATLWSRWRRRGWGWRSSFRLLALSLHAGMLQKDAHQEGHDQAAENDQ